MSQWEGAGKSDEWYTPRYIFEALGEIYALDVAAPPGGCPNVPCARYLTAADDGLSAPWTGFVWMNPPFANQANKLLWLRKFFEHGNGVALLPDRTSAKWWQEAARRASAVCFVAPKVKFERPDGTRGEQPSTGTCLFAAGERGAAALRRCGLGVTL